MKTINLKIVTMNETNMQELESRGLITRLLPSREHLRFDVGIDSLGKKIYESDVNSGTHSLVHCTIGYKKFKAFGVHAGNEEFLLIGGINEQDLLLLVALDTEEIFKRKFEDNLLSENDFICLKCVFNDPNLSFFVMNEGTVHGEMAIGQGYPSTFYVTEGSKLELKKYELDTKYNILLAIDN